MRIELLERPEALAGIDIAGDFGAIVPSLRLGPIMTNNLASGGVIAAAVDGGLLRGYATVVDFEPDWRRFSGLPGVVELGAIEVARGARRRGLGKALLARLFREPRFESQVTLTYGASSHWEPEVGGLAPFAYRKMLVGLLRGAGFAVQDTDDPETQGSRLDFLAARIGIGATPP